MMRATLRLGAVVSRQAVPRPGFTRDCRREEKSRWIYGLLGTAACLLGGCGSDLPFGAMMPIEGTITYEDGTPIPGVYLQFIPQTPPLDAKTYPRPGVAQVDADGTIVLVSSYKYRDGIVSGKHKVMVKSQDGAGVPTGAVDKKYGSARTTPLVVDTANMPFQIKVEKPNKVGK